MTALDATVFTLDPADEKVAVSRSTRLTTSCRDTKYIPVASWWKTGPCSRKAA